MQTIDKSLAPQQQKVADVLEDLYAMISLTYEGFIKHKKAPLAEAEALGRKVHEFEKAFDEAIVSGGDRDGARALLALAGHIERVGACVEGVIRVVHSKINENTLFSEKAVSELTYVYNTVKDLARHVKDVVLTLNPFLADHVVTTADTVSAAAQGYATAHEERLISGVCQPLHSSMYLDMVHNLRTAAWHLREMAIRLKG